MRNRLVSVDVAGASGSLRRQVWSRRSSGQDSGSIPSSNCSRRKSRFRLVRAEQPPRRAAGWTRRSGSARGAAPAAPAPPEKSPAELAAEAVAYKHTRLRFRRQHGRRSRARAAGFHRAGDGHAGRRAPSANRRCALTHPLIVKTPELDRADDPRGHRADSSNLGVSGMMLPKAESADQVRQAIAAMRFKSKGGTRPDDVGAAPAFWGMSEAEYKAESRRVAAQS